jgi:glycosyltransferase involved in cell wall biosynthesis
MRLITIIPAYNEEKAIKDIVKCSMQYCDVMVVDDGSSDDTYNQAKNSGAEVIKHERNRGKGAAIKSGLNKALNDGYDAFILLDGDGQHDPANISLFSSFIGEYGLIVGSRFINGNPENMPLTRILSNKVTTMIIRYVTGYELTDSQNGFRALSKECARLFLDITYDDYVYESEMIYIAARNKIMLKEVAIPSKYGLEKSHITKLNIFNYIFFILKLLSIKLKSRVNKIKLIFETNSIG